MKLKENKGMTLILFTIILAVLLVIAGGIIIYLLNNPVKEDVTVNRLTDIENLNYTGEVQQELTNESTIQGNIENNQIITKELTAKEKSDINKKLSQSLNLSAINYAETLIKNINVGGEILNSDKSRYELLLLADGFLNDDITYISNGYISDQYMEISKFQEYAKKIYNKELNTSSLKEYLYKKDNNTYILVTMGGLAAESAIKADYIIENKAENSKSLYLDIIDLYDNNLTSEEINNYLSHDFLNYDKTKVSHKLKITYTINSKTQEYYILSIESIK